MPGRRSRAPLNDSVPAAFPDSLTARVLSQVKVARLLVDRRANATRPKSRGQRPAHTASVNSLSLEELREFQSLLRVFRDLGVCYRRYRERTGGHEVPGLRDAAYNFRAEPSLTSLVAVAALLDELDLLS